MLWYAMGLAGCLLGLIALAVAAGSLLPRAHVSERSLPLRARPEAVWGVITDFPDQTAWRPSLRSVERVPVEGEREVWRETIGKNVIDLAIDRSGGPRRLVREIVDEDLPFSGSWEFRIDPREGDGTLLTVTERGEVPNPVFRLMARLFMDPAEHVERYLNDLARRFGEPGLKAG